MGHLLLVRINKALFSGVFLAFAVFIGALLPKFAFAAGIADHFVFPLNPWVGNTIQHGEEFSAGLYHVGTDAGFGQPEGTPVYAVANGVVKESQERSGFGLVVLIEHTLPESAGGNTIVSVYGHLSVGNNMVSPGQEVSVGQQIGVLGNTTEAGSARPHIHFGIHKSAYTGVWVYYGHVSDLALIDDWYDPAVFIPEHAVVDDRGPKIRLKHLRRSMVVHDVMNMDVRVKDKTSGVASVVVKLLNKHKHHSQVIQAINPVETPDIPISYDMLEKKNGRWYIRIIATDKVGNTQRKTIPVFKNSTRVTALPPVL
ncbi:MAG: M23 family metallopeptidase [Candidatus Kerfeldbacteria bacterium]|nr:M23 family metallopeptidase [Candidatus Kerfeldbacteria bacterium]